VPAGTYKGRRIDGIGEWIMYNAKIPCAEYQAFVRQFNPVKFDAEEWVRLAKDAGMRYIVITSKHHDGFAMFDSQASPWNIMKASPFGRDPLKELAAACKKFGIRLGFYYSQAQDWNNVGGGVCGTHWDPAHAGSMDDYIRNVAVPQVKEILTHYGPISVLWWDTPCDMNEERADQLIRLLKLQPGIIHNNRLGGGHNGDTETPEQFVPATGYPGRDWETCMTMNDTWGYKSYDNDWKSAETLIRNLIDIASKGGNYLLNVGPTSEGLIPAPSVERLQEVGQWMKANGAAIYATTASPFKRLPWGRCTKKVTASATTLYLHVFNWPTDGKLFVPGLKNSVESASLLSGGPKLRTESAAEGVTVFVPPRNQGAISTTVVLRIQGAPQVDETLLGQSPDGSLVLPATEAVTHGEQIRYEGGESRDCIGFWTDPKDWVEWQFKVARPGKFNVTADVAAVGSGSFTVDVGAQKLEAKAPATGDYGKFQKMDLGVIELTSPGNLSLAVRAVADGWQPFNLRSITLTPVK
jgi:alpha-L-fucosidase